MGFLKRPKAPEPSAQELAVVERQSRRLDEEIEESEKRLKAIARGRLGSASLLASGNTSSTRSGKRTSGSTGGSTGSMLGSSGGAYGSSGLSSNTSGRARISRV